MCASRGLLHQTHAGFSPLPLPKRCVTKQLARPIGQPYTKAVRGLPALQLRRHHFSSSRKHPGPPYATADAAAVSHNPGSAPSPASSSSSPGVAPPAGADSSSGPSTASIGSSNVAAASTTASSAATGTISSPNGSTGTSSSPAPGTPGTPAGVAAAAGASTNSSSGSAAAPPGGAAAADTAPFSLKPVYVLIFTLLFLGGLLFASMSLQLTSDMGFRDALTKVVRRIFRSIAFRQLVVITACILLVRFALNNVLRFLARWSSSPVQWDKSKLYYVMKEVYSPLELLLFVAGCCTIADSFVPQLVNVPKATVNQVVRAVLSMSFVMGASVVVYNLKSRFCKEQAWNCEMQGDVTSQRRWEAYDKLGTFAIYVIGTIMVIQALGLEVRSVLAIGGIGGLAIGLAGREICENLLNGFLLMTTMPFEVGEEVMFRPKANEMIEGIVVDVGWYRTLIRSFEREMYVIPNAVFSKNTVLNVTRKMREWRFYEYLCVRVQDVHKVNAIIQDIRRIVRNDARIMNKLHRRVFLDKIGLEDCKVYISFYVEASNRDAFMAVKQDLLLAFVDCVERNGAKLAQPRTVLELDPSVDAEALLPRMSAVGLLPAPPGSGGLSPYGGRGMGPSNIPITVQVVDSVEVTPVDTPGSSNGSSSSSKGSSKAGASNGTAAGKPAEQQQQQQQQVQQPQPQPQQALQPTVAFAGAGGVSAGTAAAAAAAAGGKVLDAAGMAAGTNAQRKGDGPGQEEGGITATSTSPIDASQIPSSVTGGGSSSVTEATPAQGETQAQVSETKSTGATSSSSSSSSSTAKKNGVVGDPGYAGMGSNGGRQYSSSQGTAGSNAAKDPASPEREVVGAASSSNSSTTSAVYSQYSSGGRSSGSSGGRSNGSSGGGGSSSSSSGSSSRVFPNSRSGSPYTVITGSAQGGPPGSPTAAQQRPDSVTILASFEDL